LGQSLQSTATEAEGTHDEFHFDDQMEIDGYRLLQRLGHGKFGIAYLALGRDTGEPVCVKVFRDRAEALHPDTAKSFQAEVEAGNAGFDHAHVI